MRASLPVLSSAQCSLLTVAFLPHPEPSVTKTLPLKMLTQPHFGMLRVRRRRWALKLMFPVRKVAGAAAKDIAQIRAVSHNLGAQGRLVHNMRTFPCSNRLACQRNAHRAPERAVPSAKMDAQRCLPV